jgi:glycosyltransferase involved in cell wall biosynthesis
MNAAPPLVTIAIPAYDRPELLRETLASLAAQTHRGYEVVVCDDLRREETRRIVAEFPTERFAYVPNPGAPGAIANWNRCLRAGRAPWVTVLHEDDTLYPWWLATVAGPMQGDAAAVAVKTVQGATPPALAAPRSRAEGALYPPRYFLKGAMTPFPGVAIRRAVAERLGGFDERWGPIADYEFWYRLACAGPVRQMDAVAAFYRVSPGQWTERAWGRMLPLAHLLRLRIAREQFPRSPRGGRWLARFFTYRHARAYARRFPEQPAALARALRLGRIPLAGLPSGWVWQALKTAA